MNKSDWDQQQDDTRFEPPKLENYRISSRSTHEHRRIQAAPEIGGMASILAEFDAATRSDQFSRVLQKLISCRQNVVPELIARLESSDLAVAKKASLALGYLRSPQAVPSLARVAQKPFLPVHWHAASALGCIGTSEAIGFLVKLLRHPSDQVQASAARALSRGNLPAVSPLVDALKNGNDLVKMHAAHSLGKINSPLAVPALIKALDNQVKAIRLESAWALGQIRSPLAANALAARLTDTDISVQSQSAQALKSIGAPAMPALVNMLNNEASNTRSVAVRTLGQMGIEEVIPVLVEVLRNDSFPYVRCDAATALGEIGSYDAVFHLAQTLKDSDRAVRNSAARALRKINSPEAQKFLKTHHQAVNVPRYSVASMRSPDTIRLDDDDLTILQ
ncbi:PBS lyase HEAT domain protein repeat-containing protein [Thalassoporum mexicanum PCC 7367]|uniref:HEAT repeat domain-containing protein n=1 Tax=Thalassoporum mexicanum TaxID=3457544 RepID=UPI00029F9FBE|nr:HEAT repeat domain-containing protein [Pseudanabaena sp. PCC 7367]AFY71432.1 PBS lyase HEAT domain protein repeat-containing protein [Pseudanabaena sp. PCC 7367]